MVTVDAQVVLAKLRQRISQMSDPYRTIALQALDLAIADAALELLQQPMISNGHEPATVD